MPASVAEEAARQVLQIQDAFERGQAALVAGDKPDAVRWLDRAHRLAPGDATITLVLASAAIGYDNPRAAALFEAVLAIADVRDAWFGLATARFLMRELPGARDAIAEALARNAVWADIEGLAGQVAIAIGAAGWCGLTGAGVVEIHPVGPHGASRPFEIRIDGTPVDAAKLPATWPRAGSLTVIEGGNGGHLIGSPISLRAIGRVEGHVEAVADGLSGWAWCPGDQDTDPLLSVTVGRMRKDVIATGAAGDVRGLPPLARPRRFALRWDELPAAAGAVRVRGRDGLELPGSPIGRPGSAGVPRSPQRPATRRRLDLTQWRAGKEPTVLLVTHGDGGGVERRVQASVASHEANGYRAIVLRPAQSQNNAAQIIASSDSLPDLKFELPRERTPLLQLLKNLRPVAAEVHHLLNHDLSIIEIIHALGIPYDAHIHDYMWFCPRIALVGRGDRYCGEPAPAVCQSCVNEMGSYLHEDISVAALLGRSRRILSGAHRIIAPSHDAAARLARHFPALSPIVIPHEDDDAVPEPPPMPHVSGTIRVCLGGAIGLHKGFHVLLACARDARERDLPLEFVVAGTTIDDQRLMETGRVFVTGPYQPEEAVTLIQAQHAALAFLPSIWPETWCLALTELWRAGLRVAAFDIGAPAERIRRTNRGILLPLDMTPDAINDTLLKAARGRLCSFRFTGRRPTRFPGDATIS